MKNLFVKSIFLFCFFVLGTTSSFSQSSASSNSHHYDSGKDKESDRTSISVTETDRTYQFVCRFNKRKTNTLQNYLNETLGKADKKVGRVRQVWTHVPGKKTSNKMEITLREGHFSIKAKDGCSDSTMEELKAIAEDIKSIL